METMEIIGIVFIIAVAAVILYRIVPWLKKGSGGATGKDEAAAEKVKIDKE